MGGGGGGGGGKEEDNADSDSDVSMHSDGSSETVLDHLIIEIWDSDGILGRGDFLGRIGISSSLLNSLDFFTKNKGVHEFKLGACPELPASDNAKAGGTVTIMFTPTTLQEEKTNRKKVTLHVLEAFGLAKADRFGKSDPFAVLSLNGERIGKTKVRSDTMEPIWDDGFVIEVPRGEHDLAKFIIEVSGAICCESLPITKQNKHSILARSFAGLRRRRLFEGRLFGVD